MKTKIVNRWSVVFGAVLLQICIGAIYSWSLFNQPIMDKFGWDKSEVVLTFSIAVFMFGFSTMFSGRLQDKIGPRIVAMIGGVLYGSGLMLASTATSIMQLYIYYGVIAGAGVGVTYVCPLSTCLKWFPEKKGFITGIGVGAFGLGSFVFKFVIQAFLAAFGVSTTFLYLGIIYVTLVLIGAQFMKLPPEGYGSPAVKTAAATNTVNLTTGEMLKTRSFYIAWIIFLFGCTSGLLVIGLAKDIGVQLANLSPEVAANAVAMVALFNAGGRMVWGTLSDKLGRIKVVFMMFSITAVSMIAMSLLTLNFITYFTCIAGIAFCFGGFLAVFPSITGEFFGMKNLASNYGIMFQAFSLAALTGPFIVAIVGGLKPTFIIAAILSILGAGMTFLVKAPLPVPNEEPV